MWFLTKDKTLKGNDRRGEILFVDARKEGIMKERVRRILTPNWFIWQIQDEGIGIVKNKRQSSLPLDIDANSGRGIYLIHKCFDDVRWSSKGNRLQLSLKK